MAPILKLVLVLACSFLPTFQHHYSAPRGLDDETTLSIAIVGAGITGASAAYHFSQIYQNKRIKVCVTIFETASQVGGRLQSQHYVGNYVAENGAQHFSENDGCLISAVDALNLRKNLHVSGTTTVGLWSWNGTGNGNKLLLDGQGLGCSVGIETGTLRDLFDEGIRLLFPPVLIRGITARATKEFRSWTSRLWRYGILPPRRLHHAVAEDLDKWKHFAQAQPFSNLNAELTRTGFSSRMLRPAKEYINVTESFAHSQIEPCTRAVFCQNLDQLRGLGIAISSDPGHVISLWDGNSKLVESMIFQSRAVIKTNSQVTQIKHGVHRRYQAVIAQAMDEIFEFDTVILAGVPDNLSSMLSDILLPHEFPSPPQYTEALVTHFTTERLLHLPRSKRDYTIVPLSVVYFTDSPNQDFPSVLHASTSLASQRDCDDEFECDQFTYHQVYRIVSQRALSDKDIGKLVGVTLGVGETLEAKDVTRVQRAAWPRAFPRYQQERGVSGNIELAPGILYLSGGEKLVSSLEMRCRMGRNAARLIIRGEAKPEKLLQRNYDILI